MQQIFTHAVAWNSGSNTQYAHPWIGRQAGNATLASVEAIQPVAGTIRNLRVRAVTALTGAQQMVFALFVNGSATALTVTLNSGAQEATDTTNDVSVSAGDTIAWRRVGTNTPPSVVCLHSFEFEATDANTSCYGFGGGADVVGNTTSRDALMFGGGAWSSDATDTQDIVATPGSFTELRIKLSATPGAGNTRTFTIYKNGTAQDGTGGTSDTRVTISNPATTGSSSFSLPVVAGDLVVVRHTVTGTPGSHRAIGTCAFVSTQSNRWNYGGSMLSSPSTSVTQYQAPNGGTQVWDNTESNRHHLNGPTNFWLSGLRLRFTTAPGSGGDAYAYTLRRDAADTGQTISIVDAATSGTDFGETVEIQDGDFVAMKSVPSVTPSSPGSHQWCFVGSNADPGPGEGGSTAIPVFIWHYRQQRMM